MPEDLRRVLEVDIKVVRLTADDARKVEGIIREIRDLNGAVAFDPRKTPARNARDLSPFASDSDYVKRMEAQDLLDVPLITLCGGKHRIALAVSIGTLTVIAINTFDDSSLPQSATSEDRDKAMKRQVENVFGRGKPALDFIKEKGGDAVFAEIL